MVAHAIINVFAFILLTTGLLWFNGSRWCRERRSLASSLFLASLLLWMLAVLCINGVLF